MKKILIASFAVIVAVAVALFVWERPAGKTYNLVTVSSTVESAAAVLGGSVVGRITLNGDFRSIGPFGSLKWLRKLTRAKPPANTVEFEARIGPEKISITSLHKSGIVREMRIDPSPSTSKQSENLKREILKGLPGMKINP